MLTENLPILENVTIFNLEPNTLWEMFLISLPAISIFLACYFLLNFIKMFLISRLQKFSKKNSNKIYELIIRILKATNWLFFVFLSLVISLYYLDFSSTLILNLNQFSLIVVVLYITKILQLIVNFTIDEYFKKDLRVTTPVKVIIDILIWVLSLSLILQNLGFNLNTLVAGFGVGGIAIAFAIQNILADIFSSFSIYLDKPFEEGDLILVGDDIGYVSKIGLKSTRLKTLHGEELVISNKELTTTRVKNFKNMQERRVVFTVGIDSGTSINLIQKTKELLTEIVSKQKSVHFERVSLKELGSERVFFEVVYFVKNKDYYFYTITQEKIMFDILYEFRKHNISSSEGEQKLVITKV